MRLPLERGQVDQLGRGARHLLELVAHRCGHRAPASGKEGISLRFIPYAVRYIRPVRPFYGGSPPARNILAALHGERAKHFPASGPFRQSYVPAAV
ncbi:hypothetical protein G6F59_017764 [Rhizopus arrhizus]|nr:hypothetical protein G6F59_017764 [Rhizopus arrhizus]